MANKTVYKKKKTTTVKPQRLKSIKNTFFTSLPQDASVSILKKKEIFLNHNSRRIKASHVIVRIKTQEGKNSSFEAMVNEKTSQVIRTWNQTKFETDQSVKISARGKEFYSN